MNEDQLQREITAALKRAEIPGVTEIRLGPDADVLDLAANVSVYVVTFDAKEREFTIISQERVSQLRLMHSTPDRPYADLYTTGCPLVIVLRITGDSIVRAVRRYLELESLGD